MLCVSVIMIATVTENECEQYTLDMPTGYCTLWFGLIHEDTRV